ncbi:hypothetical protein [Caballeronia sp. KNU42]
MTPPRTSAADARVSRIEGKGRGAKNIWKLLVFVTSAFGMGYDDERVMR